MRARKLGPFTVSAIGLGCMGMSQSYGEVDLAESERVLLGALDAGYTFFDTAALYGFGHNESLIGRVLGHRRKDFVLASKCGLFKDAQGRRTVDGSPETVRRTCEESLKRLRTDVIDLYYLHRIDAKVPVEDSVGALAELVRAGKVKTIGLCEMSSSTLRRAHAVHSITAVQSEYSLWTRNPEAKILPLCRELGIGFVPYCPLGRGFLTGKLRDAAQLGEQDLRRTMPRFQGDHFTKNLALLEGLAALAKEKGCTMAQLALAWVLAQGEDILPIPGTKRVKYMLENAAAVDVSLSTADLAKLDDLVNPTTVTGARYDSAFALTLDSENE
ncbi:MAG: aldo/keto reductase [Gammaproteobacteria bacterium]|nr:aldo/keto reductase [Gammaproteobacteria bacterium]